MTQDDRIKCSVEYPGLWLGMEISLAPGEDAIAAFIRTKATVDAAYQRITGGEAVQSNSQLPETQVTKVPEDSRAARVQMFVNEINQCTEIDKVNSFGVQVGLLAFEELSKSDPTIMDAYLLKLKSLQ